MVKTGKDMARMLAGAALLVLAANALFFSLVLATDAAIDHRKLFDRMALMANLGVVNDQDNPPDLGHYADRYTDCIAIGLNLVVRSDRSAIDLLRDMDVAQYRKELTGCPALVATLRNQNTRLINYNRYWHGYQIFSKPFLSFGELRDFRYILACLAVMSILTFALLIASAFTGAQIGALYGIWFAGAYLLLTDGADLANVFTHAISLLTIFLTAIGLFYALCAGYRRHLFLVAVAAGSLVSFFDLLFNPPMALSALIVAGAAATYDDDLTWREVANLTATVAFGWAIGFFGTYACRFGIAILLANDLRATFIDIFDAAVFRISGIEDKVKPVVAWATIKNYGYPVMRPSFGVFAIITAAVVVHLRMRGHKLRLNPAYLALLAPTFISVVWFEVMRNHSQHHHWFTYRSASFSLVCLASILLFGLSGRPKIPLVQGGR